MKKRISTTKQVQQLPDDPQERRRVLDELDAAKPPEVKAREWARDARFNRKLAIQNIAKGPTNPLSDEWIRSASTALYFLSCSIGDAINGRALLKRDPFNEVRSNVHSAAEVLLRIATKYPPTQT